jgi:hypothetical protein
MSNFTECIDKKIRGRAGTDTNNFTIYDIANGCVRHSLFEFVLRHLVLFHPKGALYRMDKPLRRNGSLVRDLIRR